MTTCPLPPPRVRTVKLASVERGERVLVPGDDGICLSPEVVDTLARHTQWLGDTEAGGLLIGRRFAEGGLAVDLVTTPGPADLCSAFHFRRQDPCHNEALRAAWETSEGTSHYLGVWHTHPEPDPTPSPLDIAEWERDATEIRQQLGALRMIYVIVGQERLGLWEVLDG